MPDLGQPAFSADKHLSHCRDQAEIIPRLFDATAHRHDRKIAALTWTAHAPHRNGRRELRAGPPLATEVSLCRSCPYAAQKPQTALTREHFPLSERSYEVELTGFEAVDHICSG